MPLSRQTIPSSGIVPFAGSPDVNLVINHNHPAAAEITIRALEPFVLDPRLFQPVRMGA
jgi:hypothetical protein